MIIQNPELIELKEKRAREDIGRHLMVGLSCKDGIVIGKKRNERSGRLSEDESSAPSWVSFFDGKLGVFTIGDLGDMKEFHSAIRGEQEHLGDLIRSRYITFDFTEKLARHVMQSRFEEEVYPYGLQAVVVPFDNLQRFSQVNYDGKLKRFSYFVVAGCTEDSPECREARTSAVDFLTEKWGEKQSGHWTAGGYGIKRLVEILDRFDPEGGSDTLEIFMVNEKGFQIVTVDL